MRALAVALLTFSLLAAGPALGQDKAKESPKPSTEYYPLKKGAAWTYRTGGKTVTVRVAGFEDFQEKKDSPKDVCARLEYVTRDGTGSQAKEILIATEAVTVREDGVYRCLAGGLRKTPPLCFLRLPIRSGEKWGFDSKVGGQEIKGGFVEGTAKAVKVPAGTYDTVTVASRGDTMRIDGQVVRITYYFAAKVGLVKQVVEIGGATTTLELVKYEEPKK